MNSRMRAKLEGEMTRHQIALENLANERLNQLRLWFEGKFNSDKTLELIFGMGACYSAINKIQIDVECDEMDYRGKRPACLKPIAEALNDIDEITDQYRRACPENLIVKGLN